MAHKAAVLTNPNHEPYRLPIGVGLGVIGVIALNSLLFTPALHTSLVKYPIVCFAMMMVMWAMTVLFGRWRPRWPAVLFVSLTIIFAVALVLTLVWWIVAR